MRCPRASPLMMWYGSAMSDDTEIPPSTTPMPLATTVGGFADTNEATEFAHILVSVLHTLGTVFDLSRLEAVTATDDYPAALAAVDRGFAASNVAARSENENMVGVAMCVFNLREGVPMVHLLFEIGPVLALKTHKFGDPEYAQALQRVAHECAHIEDMKKRDEAYPGVILQQKVTDVLDHMFLPTALSMWEEYYACRRTALFWQDATVDFATVLLGCLETCQPAIDDAIRRYRDHADLDVLVDETLERSCRIFKLAAYLIGHLDGLVQDWGAVPEIAEQLASTELGELMDEMANELRRLWHLDGQWHGVSDFSTLMDIAIDGYGVAGVTAMPGAGGGALLDVPFTSHTV